ncbi:MAG: galactitol-1-phosphate 5-dehydrogenase [Clostridiales bacterium]|nr:galactitol-1-phosphate 5-dehydrogenase [Clostridiales bacterium]
MKALNLYDIGDLRYEEVPMPEPEADEVLLKVLAAGICGSDVPRVFTTGTYYFPTIPGHEFAGEIVATGTDVSRNLLGKRAAVFPLLPCFACDACKGENYASCQNYDYYGSRRDGAFAEYIAVKAWNLVLIPENVPTVWAAMTEPCAVAVHAIGEADLRKNDTVCIFGAGAIGLIIAQLARGMDARVILLDIDDEKLSFAQHLGFTHTLNVENDEECMDTVESITGGRGADICIDAAGTPGSIAGCLKAAGTFATIVLLGNPSSDMVIGQEDYWLILRKQLTLIGTWNSDFGKRKNDWKTALLHMESGSIDLSKLITHAFALIDSDAAFELARDRNEFFVKILFLPHERDEMDENEKPEGQDDRFSRDDMGDTEDFSDPDDSEEPEEADVWDVWDVWDESSGT